MMDQLKYFFNTTTNYAYLNFYFREQAKNIGLNIQFFQNEAHSTDIYINENYTNVNAKSLNYRIPKHDQSNTYIYMYIRYTNVLNIILHILNFNKKETRTT